MAYLGMIIPQAKPLSQGEILGCTSPELSGQSTAACHRPRRAGHIRNHPRAARPCSIQRRVGIQRVEMAISSHWFRIFILHFPENTARVVIHLLLPTVHAAAGQPPRHTHLLIPPPSHPPYAAFT